MTRFGTAEDIINAAPPRSPRLRRHRHAIAAVGTAVALAAVGITTGTASVPAAAQSVPINVAVRTSPERPKPGDDVEVWVQIEGCVNQPATAEVYLETDDDVKRSAIRVARAGIATSVAMRTIGTVTVPDAIEGYYGIRVLCGTHLPPRRSLPGTLFHVRPDEASAVTVKTELALNEPLVFSGNNCPAGTVEWDVSSGFGAHGGFIADGSTTATGGGDWMVNTEWPDGIVPGPLTLRVRCGWDINTMTPRHVIYPTRWDLTAK